MRKRVFILFSFLAVFYVAICLRLYSIGTQAEQAVGSAGAKTIKIAQVRGNIYDCKMNKLTNEKSIYYAAVKPTAKAYSELKYLVTEQNLSLADEKMKSGMPFVIPCVKNAAHSDDITTVACPVRYSGTAAHIIGYSDAEGNGVCGIEKAYNGLLTNAGYVICARFAADARGNSLLGAKTEISLPNNNKSGVVLTLDRDIQRATEEALDTFGIECGAAVVIEIKSGAIRACVSRPDYDPYNVADSLDDPDSPLINRALLPFSVGSVFKPVIAAAALESGISEDFTNECTGSTECSGVKFNCHNKTGHGVLNMQGAISHSCNTYFIALAQETGAEKIVGIAEKFGFGIGTQLCDNMSSADGYMPDIGELDSSAAIANLSFGQGSLTATPLQICALYASIARNGIYIEPYLIEGETNELGVFVPADILHKSSVVISENTAEKLRKFLENAVENGGGKNAKPQSTSAAGKTATAQTGAKYDGNDVYNVWYAGYFPADEPEYAVVVLKENGDSGSSDCAPVFAHIADAILSCKKPLSQNG